MEILGRLGPMVTDAGHPGGAVCFRVFERLFTERGHSDDFIHPVAGPWRLNGPCPSGTVAAEALGVRWG
ncbi:hypothetical protein ACIBG8_10055 [Nonomuraea sp. NPDC050556]|uniref:hypothetical protein n=1 Tax=Nonomuraea sp. NPDC050556 TaxID=3364369 RepID=UPI0037B8AEB9